VENDKTKLPAPVNSSRDDKVYDEVYDKVYDEVYDKVF
jgi:hypothetical protein